MVSISSPLEWPLVARSSRRATCAAPCGVAIRRVFQSPRKVSVAACGLFGHRGEGRRMALGRHLVAAHIRSVVWAGPLLFTGSPMSLPAHAPDPVSLLIRRH